MPTTLELTEDATGPRPLPVGRKQLQRILHAGGARTVLAPTEEQFSVALVPTSAAADHPLAVQAQVVGAPFTDPQRLIEQLTGRRAAEEGLQVAVLLPALQFREGCVESP